MEFNKATRIVYDDTTKQDTNRSGGFFFRTAKAGISFGSCLAIVISYDTYHSIFWSIIDGLLGWIYVIYAIIFN